MIRFFYISLVAALALPLALTGCRGMKSERTPIHLNPNMDHQERFEEQEANPFFADGSSMRMPVPGTVARGHLRTTTNAPFELGRDASGQFVASNPMTVDATLLERGQERFNIYCTPCHGFSGDGRGIIMVGNGGQGYGFVPAPTYHSDFLRGVPDGYLYSVMANGVRSMPSYAHEIAPADRWAIVAYIRALQLSQDAGPEDVPEPERDRLATYNPNVNVTN
ncbi:MAG: cytochrome c [Bacteroidetes bacterium]|nr:cytochrome c [Bacteroidota bacterium]